MKKNFIIASAFLTSIALFSFKSIESMKWTIDQSHSNVRFAINHLTVNDVEGGFKKYDATITTTNENMDAANLDVTIDAASIFTGDEKRDGHLKSADFFDVEKFPKITFKSEKFERVDDNKYMVQGILTMHGVSKSIELNAVIKSTKNPMSQKLEKGAKITGKISRREFGIGEKMPDAIISDEIDFVANGEFILN